MHKIGIYMPLVNSKCTTLWVFKYYDKLIIELINKFAEKLDEADSTQSIMFFWGIPYFFFILNF